MRAWLIVLLFLLSACKNQNQTQGTHHLSFKAQVAYQFNHGKEKSILRRKLLNLQTRAMIKDQSPLADEEILLMGDEFKWGQSEPPLAPKELEEYKTYRSLSAEVIVSYEERIEIYFIPAGVRVLEIIKKLKIFPDFDAKFFILNPKKESVEASDVIYILSATSENLKSNDQFFHRQKLSLQAPFKSNIWLFSSFQKVELILDILTSIEDTVVGIEHGPIFRCTPERMEADLCTPCSYVIEKKNGRLKKEGGVEKIDSIFAIEINGQIYKATELNFKALSASRAKVVLDLRALSNSKGEIALRLLDSLEIKKRKMVKGKDYSPYCDRFEISRELEIKELSSIELTMDISGRTLKDIY